jgi:hypothetical protein
MAMLTRPGGDPLVFRTAAQRGRLWAFDSRGRAVDPGAAAAWLESLARLAFTNLWHDPAVAAADRRTALVDDRRTVQLVDPHEGPPPAALLARVEVANLDGTGPVRSVRDPAQEVRISFSAAPTGDSPDGAPLPRAALLPAGVFAPSVSLWSPPSGGAMPATLPPARDFVRVAVVDVEAHLVGQRRVAEPGANAAERDAAAAQQRASTRVRPLATARAGLLATTDEVLAAMAVALDGAAPARLIAPAVERDAGARTALSWADAPPPARLTMSDDPDAPDTISVHPLAGEGTARGGLASGQAVVMVVRLTPELAGAWVRAWPLGFDELEGAHTRLSGGAGRAFVERDGAPATAYLVVPLPDGGTSATDPPRLAVDVLVVTGRGERLFPDLRFLRPVVAGAAASLGADGTVAGEPAAAFVLCEQGELHAPPLAVGAAASGTRIVLRSSDPARAGSFLFTAIAPLLPPELLPRNALGAALQRGDIVELTPPTFVGAPRGESGDFAGPGVIVDRIRRRGAEALVQIASAPMPSQDRNEVLVAASDGVTGAAVIGATPPLARYHELGPHQQGHPGAPAAIELHGGGVRLTGPAATEAFELARARSAGVGLLMAPPIASPEALLIGARTTPALVWDLLDALQRTAWTPPTAAAVPAPHAWAAVLRTVARGVEGEPVATEGLRAAGLYPASDAVDHLVERMRNGNLFAVPAGSGVWPTIVGQINTLAQSAASSFATNPQAQAIAALLARAIDRHLQSAIDGAREAATSLLAAIGRAQDLIYVETPALSHWPTEDGTLVGSVTAALERRLREVPSLRVIACLAARPMPGTPRALLDATNELRRDALTMLRTAGPGRFVAFAPSAGANRSVRLASTTVIVDDAYALVGTAHLSRRGLTFDSSVSAAYFDEAVVDGRPADVAAYRRQLVADRLGMPASRVPVDPVDLTAALTAYVASGQRVAIAPPPRPLASLSAADRMFWDPDGTQGRSILELLRALSADTRGAAEADLARDDGT